jgi:hypothetical protein
VYVIGQEGIGEELDLLNIPHIGGPGDNDKIIKLGPGVKVKILLSYYLSFSFFPFLSLSVSLSLSISLCVLIHVNKIFNDIFI